MPRQILLLLSTFLGLWGTWSTRKSPPGERLPVLTVAWLPVLAGLLSLFFTQE